MDLYMWLMNLCSLEIDGCLLIDSHLSLLTYEKVFIGKIVFELIMNIWSDNI